MAVDRQIQAVLEEYARRGGPPTHTLSAEDARRKYARDPDFAGPKEPVAKVWDAEVPGPEGALKARFYVPDIPRPAPVLVYFHGGGWVCGGIDYVDPPLRSIANRTPCAIVSVDYRLAPEHKFPAAPKDAYAATAWVADHAHELGFDSGRVAVGGDSAGGNLATVTALMARDEDRPELCFQVLVYPVTAYDFDTPSYRENAEGYLLTRASMKWYWNHYLSGERDATQPLASPLWADVRGLPPALVLTAEYDPLRDEGEAYARHLENAGVRVRLRRYEGLVHGFFRMGGAVDQAQRALDEISEGLAEAFSA